MMYEAKCPVCDDVVGSWESNEQNIPEGDSRLVKSCQVHAPAVSDAAPAIPPAFTPTSGAVGVAITLPLRTVATSVSFNGVAASNPRMSGDSLVVDVPDGATTGALSVTPPSMSSVALGTFTVE